MTIPNKIYIPAEWMNVPKNFFEKKESIGATEYIRKDALLEKIDYAIANLSDGSLAGYYESLAYKDIRELINSM